MDQHYAAAYRDLYERHWWWRAREAMVLNLLEKDPSISTAGKLGSILDVGCGAGLLLDKLDVFGKPEGLEIDPMLAEAGRARGAVIHQQPFDKSFQPGKHFDLILMLDVLEHIEDDHGALSHALDLLSERGKLILTVPALPALWTRHDDLNHHMRRYTRTSFQHLAKETGFALERLHYFFHWLTPIKLGVRLKESLITGEPQPPSVPASWANRLCYGLCRFEQALARGPLQPLPGSSLLAVGRRHPDQISKEIQS